MKTKKLRQIAGVIKKKRLKVWSGVIGIALAVALILTLVPVGVTITGEGMLGIDIRTVSANPDWLSGYSYRKTIPITGATGAGTDYQTLVVVHSGSGTDSAGVVYLGSHCIDFPNDIRFTRGDSGQEDVEIDHWLESVEAYAYNDDDVIARFWTEHPLDLGSNQNICIYYGNSSVSSVSDDVATLLAGADFDDGTTTGLTINTASSGSATVENPTQLHSLLRVDYGHKAYSNPVIAKGAASAWDEDGVRDLGLLLDANNRLVVESGGIIGYYFGTSSAGAKAIGRATSSDGGKTWTKYGSNPVLSATASSWDEDGVSACTVVYLPGVGPDTDKPYKMLYQGWDTNGTAHSSIGLAESADGLSWTKYGSNPVLSYSAFTGRDTIGVPWMIKVGSTYVLVGEGYSYTTTDFYVYGATSSNLTSWTAMNSGGAILSWGAGGSWEDDGQANSKIIEVASGKYILAYNGNDGTNWRVGFATATDAPADWDTASWTKHTGNPVIDFGISGRWDDLHAECSAMAVDDIETGASNFRFWYQGFNVASGAESQIGLVLIPQGRILHGKSTATADGWLVGKDLDGITNFMFEILVGDNVEDANDNSAATLGLIDSAAVPSPMASASWNPLLRFVVFKYSETATTPQKWAIRYTNTAGTGYFWTGAAWSTTATYHGHEGLCRLKIYDDGTNYKCGIIDEITGSSILANVASIAKTSVKSFSNGRVVVASEPYTNVYYLGLDLDNWISRKFVDPEPVVGTAGSEEEACSPDISNTPSSWSVNSGTPVDTSSEYATGLTHFQITNNSGGAVDISIQGTDMTGGNTWTLSDTATPSSMTYGLKAGLSGGDYTIIVKKNSPYNNLVEDMPDEGTQQWGLKLYTPTAHTDGAAKTGTVTITATCV